VVSSDATSDAVVAEAIVVKTTAIHVNNDHNTSINTVAAATTVTGDTSRNSGNSLLSIAITLDNIATNDFHTTISSTEATYRSAPNTSNVSPNEAVKAVKQTIHTAFQQANNQKNHSNAQTTNPPTQQA